MIARSGLGVSPDVAGNGPTGMRVAFSSLGCKVNSSETESFISEFLVRGYRVVPFEDEADVYVINSCTVTSTADKKSRQEIRRAGRANPLALVAATGCYVSVANRDLDGLLPGNIFIVHNRDKDSLVRRVEDELSFRHNCTESAMKPVGLSSFQGRGGAAARVLPVAVGADEQRTRATLKIQDGCNAGCSFCIIPRARGGPRSVPVDQVIAAAQSLEAHGYREIVLTGVLLGSYGQDLPDQVTLAGLVERLLQVTQNARFRISSVEPQDLKPAWLDLWADSRMCRHLHLPLQSGSDTILGAMRRHYDVETFAGLVDLARKKIPDLALTTDLLVGFPGELDSHFDETLWLLERVEFAGIHVFKFSSRPGTLAARLPGHVPEQLKSARATEARKIGDACRARFHARFVGSTLPVLWERPVDGVWHGLTDNYLHAYARLDRDLHNVLVPTKLDSVHELGLWGTPVPTSPSQYAMP